MKINGSSSFEDGSLPQSSRSISTLATQVKESNLEETKKLLPEIGFFSSATGKVEASISRIGKKPISTEWASLIGAVELEDYKSANVALQELSKISKTLNTEIKKTGFITDALHILNCSLIPCYEILKKPMKDILMEEIVTVKINYWMIRGVIYVLENHIDLIPGEILAAIPWLPELLTKGEHEAIFHYEKNDNILSSLVGASAAVGAQSIVPIEKLFTSDDFGAMVYHPLYTMSKVKSELAMEILLDREPVLTGEKQWEFISEKYRYGGDDRTTPDFWLFYLLLIEAKAYTKQAVFHIEAGLSQVFIPGILEIIKQYNKLTATDLSLGRFNFFESEKTDNIPAEKTEAAPSGSCCSVM